LTTVAGRVARSTGKDRSAMAVFIAYGRADVVSKTGCFFDRPCESRCGGGSRCQGWTGLLPRRGSERGSSFRGRAETTRMVSEMT